MRFNVVERLLADAAGEPGVARHDHDILVASAQIAAHRHPEASRKRGSRVTGAVAIMLAFGSQKKTIQSAVLPHCGKAVETPGKYLVHVTLMTDVHNESVVPRVENPVQRDGQFDHAEIWTKMPAWVRTYSDQPIAHFLGQLRPIVFAQR